MKIVAYKIIADWNNIERFETALVQFNIEIFEQQVISICNKMERFETKLVQFMRHSSCR